VFEAQPSASGLQAEAAFEEWTQERPVREPTPTGDVGVPVGQALVTGILVALCSAGVTIAVGWPWWVPPAVLVGTSTLVWVWLLVDHRRLLRFVEKVVGVDLDGDGEVGEDAGRPERVKVEITRGTQQVYLDLPCGRETLRTVARAVLADQPLSESRWTGQGRPFSRATFAEFRDELLERGLLAWRNPQAHSQGVEPTRAGRAVFRYIVTLPSSEEDM
jgi:hypothetical protein